MKTKALVVTVVIMAILLVAFMIAKPFIPMDMFHPSDDHKTAFGMIWTFGFLGVTSIIFVITLIGAYLGKKQEGKPNDEEGG